MDGNSGMFDYGQDELNIDAAMVIRMLYALLSPGGCMYDYLIINKMLDPNVSMERYLY